MDELESDNEDVWQEDHTDERQHGRHPVRLSQMRSDAYFITKNGDNIETEFQELLLLLSSAEQDFGIAFWGTSLEIGELNGRQHYHLLVKTHQRRSPKWYHKVLPMLKGADFEYRKQHVSWVQSVNYIKYLDWKDPNPVVNPNFYWSGDIPTSYEKMVAGSKKGGEGMKQVFRESIAMAKQGRLESIDPILYVKHYGTWEKIYANNLDNTDRGGVVDIWIHGKSGTGKSRWCRDFCSRYSLPFYIKDPGTIWWDNYKGEPIVLLEDVSSEQARNMTYYYKIWSDRYPFAPQVKGGMLRSIRPKMLIYTSNYAFDDVFTDDNIDKQPLQRRISVHTIQPTANGMATLDPPLVQRTTPVLTNQFGTVGTSSWSDSTWVLPSDLSWCSTYQQRTQQDYESAARSTTEDYGNSSSQRAISCSTQVIRSSNPSMAISSSTSSLHSETEWQQPDPTASTRHGKETQTEGFSDAASGCSTTQIVNTEYCNPQLQREITLIVGNSDTSVSAPVLAPAEARGGRRRAETEEEIFLSGSSEERSPLTNYVDLITPPARKPLVLTRSEEISSPMGLLRSVTPFAPQASRSRTTWETPDSIDAGRGLQRTISTTQPHIQRKLVFDETDPDDTWLHEMMIRNHQEMLEEE